MFGQELALWGMVVLYAFAALDKTSPSAVAGEDMLRLWVGFMGGSDDVALSALARASVAPPPGRARHMVSA